MYLVQLLSGLLTPMIAIIAVYIAYQQYLSNKKQGEIKLKLDTDKSQLEKNRLNIEKYRLRLDLYNKRYRIFDETKKVLHKISKDSKIDIFELRDFNFNTNESKFLFDDDISSFLDELQKNAIELNHLTDDLKNIILYPVGSNEREIKTNRDGELTSFFDNEYENIERRFNIYLDFKKL